MQDSPELLARRCGAKLNGLVLRLACRFLKAGARTKLEPDKYVDSLTERFRTRVRFPPPPYKNQQLRLIT